MDGSRSYYEHDSRKSDRGGGGGLYTRGRGRQHRREDGNHYGGGSSMTLDDDVAMANVGEQRGPPQRFNPYGNRDSRGRNRNRGGGRNNQDGLRGQKPFDSNDLWIRIGIPLGKRIPKQELLHMIAQACPKPFVPINYHLDGNSANFYVDNKEAADALSSISKFLQFNDGTKIVLFARRCNNSPNVQVNSDAIRVIHECMVHRISPDGRSVNLTDFYMDAGIRQAGFYLPLDNPSVMGRVMDIVRDKASDVVRIDMRGNNLKNLVAFGNPSKYKSLTCLLLERNNIARLSDVDRLKQLNLEELSFAGNPLVSNYKDNLDYVEVVRKIFPKLVKLDGEVLPAEIGFAIEESVALPPSQHSFFISDDARGIVIQFMEQYYSLFDSNRTDLLAAYHSEAMFSTTCHRPSGAKSGSLTYHLIDSRNLRTIENSEKRSKLLYVGKSNILTYLDRFPKTSHDPCSISIDLSLATPDIIAFSVSGLFKEVANKAQQFPLRSFSRSFVLVPQGPGFCIINETLVISAATDEQIKIAFKTPAPTPSPSPATVASPIAAVPLTGEAALHQQMVVAFSQQSRMTEAFSLKCLQDNGWDFEKAANVFNVLNNQGGIPPHAFV